MLAEKNAQEWSQKPSQINLFCRHARTSSDEPARQADSLNHVARRWSDLLFAHLWMVFFRFLVVYAGRGWSERQGGLFRAAAQAVHFSPSDGQRQCPPRWWRAGRVTLTKNAFDASRVALDLRRWTSTQVCSPLPLGLIFLRAWNIGAMSSGRKSQKGGLLGSADSVFGRIGLHARTARPPAPGHRNQSLLPAFVKHTKLHVY